MSGQITSEERASEATAWLVRLQRDEVTTAEFEAFDAWLSASADNGVAYRAALALWHEFEACAPGVRDELAAIDRRAALRNRSAVTRRNWMVGGGLAAAAALTLAILPEIADRPEVQAYATGKGEHRRVALADGSTIDINAETRLTVRYDRGGRQVALSDGEAFFDVAHDADRPFTVEAAGQVVRVLGTQFDVRNRDGAVGVIVARGKVQVAPKVAQPAATYVLLPGQRLRIDRQGVGRLANVDPSEAYGWRTGRLVYRGEPLSDVVADLNRQFVTQIEVTDPDLARMPITGVIVVDDQASVIARLGLMLPVRSVPSERGTLLLRK
jgi:transmembrane sensor